MYIYYEYPKCSTCRKAKAELNQLGLEYEAKDIKENPPSKEELLALMESSSLEIKAFFNTSGIKYRELGLKDQVPNFTKEEAAALLSTDGMLIKRPILIKDGQVLQIGYRTDYADLGL